MSRRKAYSWLLFMLFLAAASYVLFAVTLYLEMRYELALDGHALTPYHYVVALQARTWENIQSEIIQLILQASCFVVPLALFGVLFGTRYLLMHNHPDSHDEREREQEQLDRIERNTREA